MAMKKPVKKAVKKSSPIEYPKGQSERSIMAQKRRNTRMGYQMGVDKRKGKEAYGKRLSEYEMKNRGEVYRGEDGGFWSTALQNKEDLKRAKMIQERARRASQQMRQGVTKSGGYAGYDSGARKDARAVNSRTASSKGKQAIKKTGKLGNARGMNSNSRNK